MCLFVKVRFLLYFYFIIHTLRGYNHFNKYIMTCNLEIKRYYAAIHISSECAFGALGFHSSYYQTQSLSKQLLYSRSGKVRSYYQINSDIK